MKNNLIINQDGEQPFTTFDDVSGLVLSNNIADTKVLSELTYGVKEKITLEKASNGLLYPTSKSLNVGAKRDLKVLKRRYRC
ncbi:hypothetical protein P4S63_03520 [Pseudoalteromonas sp. B193]